MKIKTLENTSTEEILNTFNTSFSDYSIPFKLTLEQLNAKINAEHISMIDSVGAFENDKLVGFILHGKRNIGGSVICYNGGTGVVPEKRGQRTTRKMYEYILPKMSAANVKGVILEVISDNTPAIKSYEKVGFKKQRSLNCYKGELANFQVNSKIKIKGLTYRDLSSLSAFGEVKPTWQNSNESIEKLGSLLAIFGAYESDALVGFLIWNKSSNRIVQIGVDKAKRKQGVGTALLKYIKAHFSKTASIINVDSKSSEADSFFLKCGLVNFLQQDEMYLELK